MVQSPSWEANCFAASQEIPRIYMEPEGSLPHSQASATCPCPGWDARQTLSHVLWRWQDKLNICFGFQEFSVTSRSDDKIWKLSNFVAVS